MNDENQTLIPYLELGSAFALGLAVGYALKKSFKLLLVLFGAGLLFVFYLEHQGAVNVNEENLQNIATIGVNGFQATLEFLQNRLDQYKGTGSMSAIAGFLVGLKYA